MNLLHGSMIFGMTIFLIIVIIMQNGFPEGAANFSSPLIYIAIAICTFALAFHFLLYQNRLEKIRSNSKSTAEKLTNWRTLFLLKCAITEGAAIFCLVGALVEKSAMFLYLFLAVFVLFISFFPTKNKLQSELELTNDEMAEV